MYLKSIEGLYIGYTVCSRNPKGTQPFYAYSQRKEALGKTKN
jgi:hypothetical protein